MSRALLILIILCSAVAAQQREGPLTALPYTPSLDIPSMDKSVDPCVDFYHYACGGWIKNNPIPSDQAIWNVYGKLTHENQRLLWGMLEQASKPGTARNKVEQETGDYFAACMDEATIEKLGAAPLSTELDRIAAL